MIDQTSVIVALGVLFVAVILMKNRLVTYVKTSTYDFWQTTFNIRLGQGVANTPNMFRKFLLSIPDKSLILDVGCGNGKFNFI